MEWFLIKQSEHLGPFSEEKLKHMLSRKEIGKESQLWREGLAKSISYNDAFILKPVDLKEDSEADDDFPPDLPPLPPGVGKPKKVLKAPVERKIIKKIQSPILKNKPDPVSAPAPVVEKVIQDVSDIPLSDTPTIEKISTDTRKRSYRWLVYTLLVIVTIVFGVSSWVYYQKTTSVFSRPKLMGLKDFKKLKKIALSPDQSLKFSIALAKDKKSLWIATNNPYEGEVFIQLKSINGKSLGEPVEVKASGYLKNKLITLHKFQFVTGSRFVDGIYSVEILTVDELKIPFIESFFETRETQLKYINQFLITSLRANEFKKLLIKMIKKKKSNTKLFWEELVQKYQTVKMITGQIRDGFSSIFENSDIKWTNKVQGFEQEYKSKYGIFFTEFVKTNEASYTKLRSKKFDNSQEVLANYNHLSKLATDIGAESMKVLESLHGFDAKNANEDSLLDLKTQSLINLDRIMKECEKKIETLSSAE